MFPDPVPVIVDEPEGQIAVGEAEGVGFAGGVQTIWIQLTDVVGVTETTSGLKLLEVVAVIESGVKAV